MEKDKRETPAKGGFFGKVWNRFGEIAVQLGLVSDSNIEKALAKQEAEQPRRRLGETLVDDGKITADNVKEVLRIQKELAVGTEALSDEEAKPVKKKSRKATATKSPKRKAGEKAAKAKPAKKKPRKATAKKSPKKKAVKKAAKAKPVRKKSQKATATKPPKKKAVKKAAKAKPAKR